MDSAGGIEGNERGWGEGAWAQERRLPRGHSLGGCRAAARRWGGGGRKSVRSAEARDGRGAVLNVFPS